MVDAAFVPTASMLQTDGSVDQAALAATLTEAVGPERTLLADTTGLAEAVFGDHLPANVVLLGAAFQRGALPLPLDALDQAIAEQGRAAAMNLEALTWGRWLAHDPAARGRGRRSHGIGRGAPQAAHLGPVGTGSPPAPGSWSGNGPCPPPCGTWPSAGPPSCSTTRAPASPAAGWTSWTAAAAADDADHGLAFTEAVAEGWFKLLTYKDEYEVARLHLRLDLDEVADEIGLPDGYRVQYHLHPPTLRRLGVDHKIAIGGGVGRLAFRGLAALRRVRGTPLDVFGYARHRREERPSPTSTRASSAAAISRLSPDDVRGGRRPRPERGGDPRLRGHQERGDRAVAGRDGRCARRGHGRVSASFKVVRFLAGEPSTAEVLRRGWAAAPRRRRPPPTPTPTDRRPAGRCA